MDLRSQRSLRALVRIELVLNLSLLIVEDGSGSVEQLMLDGKVEWVCALNRYDTQVTIHSLELFDGFDSWLDQESKN